MVCVSCASRITRVLRRLDGVVAARVDFASDSATITFEPGRTDPARIAAAVAASGYEAEIDEPPPAG